MNWVITKNQNVVFEKKKWDDAKKIKRLTGIQVLTKDFTSCKIIYKSLRKRK